ncbi:MAG: transcriptional regulator, MerR family [Chthonomonadales bacterium]|nr:transcriptional regulator, MerR family [Chthonomonadales bacterium]
MRKEHTIQKAAQLAGLTPHTIRAWERRYGVLTPERTPSNQRLYTDAEVEKLALLQKVVQSGHRIGQVAGLPLEELRGLVFAQPLSDGAEEETVLIEKAPVLEECLLAIERFDPEALEHALARAAARLGAAAMIDQVVVPLLEHLGAGWRDGNVRIADEHIASTVLRTYLMRTLGSFQPPKPSPLLVVTTPTGQNHEFGALLAAVTATLQGWRVLYLGANLPADEIAGAVHRAGAQAIALSIVYPPDDLRLSDELPALRRSLGDSLPILIGGRGANAYHAILTEIGALVPGDLQGLRTELEVLQSRANSPSKSLHSR